MARPFSTPIPFPRGVMFVVLTALALPGLSGCTSYQLGTGSAPAFSTLFVAPVRIDALIPQAQVLVTTQLREALIRDGGIKLVSSPTEADAVLYLALVGYNRTVVVSRSDDTGLGRRFEVTLTATATLTDNRTNKDYFTQRPLSAKRGIFTDSGLVPSEYQGMPLLAEQLAKETVHALLDTW